MERKVLEIVKIYIHEGLCENFVRMEGAYSLCIIFGSAFTIEIFYFSEMNFMLATIWLN